MLLLFVVLQDAMMNSDDPDIQRKIAKLQRKIGGNESGTNKSRREPALAGHDRQRHAAPRSGRQKYARQKADSTR